MKINYWIENVNELTILTDNLYFKVGIENLIKQEYKKEKRQIIIFDEGAVIFLLLNKYYSGHYFPDVFFILANGLAISKDDIKTKEDFTRFLNEPRGCNDKFSYHLLSWKEEMVLRALCKGYSLLEVSDILNSSVKTISSHKNRGMRKLRVSNIQALHRIVVRWDTLARGLTPFVPRTIYPRNHLI